MEPLPGTRKPTIYKWLFQLDDSRSLHRKWLEITKHLFKNGWKWGSRLISSIFQLPKKTDGTNQAHESFTINRWFAIKKWSKAPPKKSNDKHVKKTTPSLMRSNLGTQKLRKSFVFLTFPSSLTWRLLGGYLSRLRKKRYGSASIPYPPTPPESKIDTQK